MTNNPFDLTVETLTSAPNEKPFLFKQPSITNLPYRIAIIGDHPSPDELLQATPFVGMAGKLLTGLLSKAGIVKEACLLTCWQTGCDESLQRILVEFNPNIILLLGRTSFMAATGKQKGLDDYRGSLFISDVIGPFLGRKCIASYHPTAVLRQYDWIAYLWFDILKVLQNATTPEFLLPQRNLKVSLSYEDLIQHLVDCNAANQPASIDLEGYWNNLSCCSIASGIGDSFIVPFANLDGTHYWNEEQEIEIWRHFAALLSNPNVPKIFQNGLYDRFVMQYGFQVPVLGNRDDTMLKWWEKYCELEKGLGVQASILTNEPYWKFERKSDTKEAYYLYCCKDSAVTYELSEKLETKLDPTQYKHYTLNMALLNPILYMELRGIRYDKKEACSRLAEINQHIYRYQSQLDALAGVGVGFAVSDGDTIRKSTKKIKVEFNPFAAFSTTGTNNLDGINREEKTKVLNKSTMEVLARVQSTMCHKKNQDLPKKDYEQTYPKILTLLQSPFPLTSEQIGYINIECGWSMNIKSPKYKDFLYKTLALPPQYKVEDGVRRLTTDSEALLKIQKKQPHQAVEIGIHIAELRTRAQMLEIGADPDGRIRCGYNLVGTVTSRISCYTSPTGSGYNLQTIPDRYLALPEGHPLREGMRDLFKADEGCLLFQCDLKGSDGWTIGCHLASLGDPTMLDDLRFGIKPAERICYMLRHGVHSLSGKDRAEIKLLLKEIKKEDWDYFVCKVGIWGLCYLMGIDLLGNQIMEESYGKVVKTRAEITEFRNAVFTAYDAPRWHRWMQNTLYKKPELKSPTGHTRRFWGRSSDILGQALANEPQEVTTYATKLALYNMWTDVENRQGNRLICEPLHTVHDSLLLQAKADKKDWVEEKLKGWFDNKITIAGITITIPYSFEVGTNWGFTDK